MKFNNNIDKNTINWKKNLKITLTMILKIYIGIDGGCNW